MVFLAHQLVQKYYFVQFSRCNRHHAIDVELLLIEVLSCVDWIDHILRKNVVEGKIKGMRRRGKRSEQLLNDVKENMLRLV